MKIHLKMVPKSSPTLLKSAQNHFKIDTFYVWNPLLSMSSKHLPKIVVLPLPKAPKRLPKPSPNPLKIDDFLHYFSNMFSYCFFIDFFINFDVKIDPKLIPKSIQKWSFFSMSFRTWNNILFCILCDMSNSSKPSKTVVFTMVFDDFHYVNDLRFLMKNHWNFNDFWVKNDEKTIKK